MGLEGRYATALFVATSTKLDKVAGDLAALRAMMAESPEFKLMVETPGIQPESKVAAIEDIAAKAGTDPNVVNFLKVLVENKRMLLLPKMIDLFESFYRAEKGLVPCIVSSAEELSSSQKDEVKAAMQKRAAEGAKLLMEYEVRTDLIGGLVVKMDEAVYDYSVATRIERLQTALLAPVA